MEEELKSLMEVGVSAIISVSYCYFIPPRIKSGFFRFVCILPVCVLFLVLPLSFSFRLFSVSAADCLLIASSRLILFSFDQGPLSPLPSNLFLFTCFTCLPIQRQRNPKPQEHLLTWILAVTFAFFGVLLHAYDYKKLPPILLVLLRPVSFYFLLEVSLSIFRILLSISLGFDLEPYFNEPFLATSLQDFWGRRWNLVVSASLRASVYTPVRRFCQRLMCSDYAMLVSVFTTFVVSGLAHELLFFYMIREMPTWEVTSFFVVHGVCTVAEKAVKRTAFSRRWVVRPMLSRVLTVAYVIVTSSLLFFPPLIRSKAIKKCFNEISLLSDFLETQVITLNCINL